MEMFNSVIACALDNIIGSWDFKTEVEFLLENTHFKDSRDTSESRHGKFTLSDAELSSFGFY